MLEVEVANPGRKGGSALIPQQGSGLVTEIYLILVVETDDWE